MEKKFSVESSIRKSIQQRREEINLADFSLTNTSYLSSGQLLPLVVQPSIAGVNLASWAANSREYIRTELTKHGAILFRNFPIDLPAKFEAFARAVSANGDLFDEYGDLPREQPGAKVYGSTPYPADKAILFHNESSHTHRWPMKIFFYCVKAAAKQGATPLLDCRKTYQSIDPAIISRRSKEARTMSGPKPSYLIDLTDEERNQLQKQVRACKTGQDQVVRAKLLLAANEHPEQGFGVYPFCMDRLPNSNYKASS